MFNKFIALFIFCLLTLLPTKVDSREVIASETFADWNIIVTQDEWGDQREIKLSTNNLVISINPKYGWVTQTFNFQRHRNYWPHCDVINITYKIDDEKPVRTYMGGKAAQNASCAWIRLPDEMLADMKKGSVMEVRSGYQDTDKVKLSLIGFTDAWNTAQKYTE